MSMCQAGPLTGKLGALAQGKREKRQQATLLHLQSKVLGVRDPRLVRDSQATYLEYLASYNYL